jgi:hypothetical protein
MKRLLLVLALAAAPSLAAGPPVRVDSLQWMTGSWVQVTDARHVSETWLGPRAGMMVATNLTVRADGRPSFEYQRIADTPDGISLFASPSGRAPVEFKLKESAGERVVFENLEHGFPQRVMYWRDGEALRARIEGVRGGSAASDDWRFVPAR